MSLLGKLVLWAEDVVHQNKKAAIQELGGVATKWPIYTEKDPVTLNRLAAISVYFLIGSRNQATASYLRISRSNNERDDGLTALLLWIISGVAFQHAFGWGIAAGSNLIAGIFSVLGYGIGAIIGATFGTITAIIHKLVTQTKDPILAAIKTGITVTAHGGKNIGNVIGSVLGLVPGALVGTLVGIVAELAVTVASVAVIGIFVAVETAKFVVFTMLNPFAWARGVSNVYNTVANAFRRLNNYTAEVYNEELSQYKPQEMITETVTTTETAILETNSPSMVYAYTAGTQTPIIDTQAFTNDESVYTPQPRP